MCDIFPDVSTCCFLLSLRIGMLLISVLAIMTGVLTLSIMEQQSNIDYNKVQDVGNIKKPQDAVEKLNTLVTSGISAMATIFMFTGTMLLFGTLFDEEGLIQMFVWGTFTGIIIGFIMVLGTVFECLSKSSCILSSMDWLSGAALLVLIVAYLFLWLYFVVVANSYVVGIVQ